MYTNGRLTIAQLMAWGNVMRFAASGRTPKQYGQWLQSTGRQKWIKKAK
jgi:hypothetical protein